MNTQFKKYILITVSLILGLSINAQKPKKNKRPNIIFLLTDDQRYDALSCTGNKEIETPNIDRLADKGVVFNKYYTTTAICMASRSQIMTGMYEYKTGCNFTHGPLSQEKFEESYPVLLRKAGYKTGFAGKFGFAVTSSATDKSDYHKDDVMPINQFDWWKGWNGQGFYKTEKNKYFVEYAAQYPHVSKALGAASVDFIKEYANNKEPFCLSVSFKAPHNPVQPDPSYNNIYKGNTFTRPANFGKENAQHLPEQSKLGRQYNKLSNHWKDEKFDASLAKYYQLIYGIDVAVGMILDELEKQGIANNTIIIYTTDNGYSTGAHGFGGKVLPYEEASRGPLLIYAPGTKSVGKKWRSEALVGNIDMAPTILDVAGLEIPNHMDGKSLLPILNKKDTTVKNHQAIIQVWGENPTHSLSIVSGNYKYLYWFYGEGMEPKEELYDLSKDAYELKNLVSDQSSRKDLNHIRKVYDEFVANWKKEAVSYNGYQEYAVLFDRHIPWKVKKELMKTKNSKKKKSRKKKKTKNK